MDEHHAYIEELLIVENSPQSSYQLRNHELNLFSTISGANFIVHTHVVYEGNNRLG